MKDQNTTRCSDHWALCYWADKLIELDNYSWQAGLVVPGIFHIPPPISDITFHDGLWAYLNSEIGTHFDQYEEEDIDVELLPIIAKSITNFANQKYSGIGSLNVNVGEELFPKNRHIIGQIPLSKLKKILLDLSEFLSDAARENKIVVMSL